MLTGGDIPLSPLPLSFYHTRLAIGFFPNTSDGRFFLVVYIVADLML